MKAEPIDDKTLLISLMGEVDVYSAPQAEDFVKENLRRYKAFIFDLQGVDFMDSAGLGMLLACQTYVEETGGSLRLICSQPKILRTFQIAGIPDRRLVKSSLEEALAGEDIAARSEARPPAISSGIVELRLPPRPEFISVARLTAAGVCHRLDLTYLETEDIKLALGEACANAIQHGSGSWEERSPIEISFEILPDRLQIEVTDPDSEVDWDYALGEGARRDGVSAGVGIAVMRHVMDEVEFRGGRGRGASVRMTKYLAGR
jgi:serine/threonine-protein kinase RsbW